MNAPTLYLKAYSIVPEKSTWHNPEVATRGEWSVIYEAITSWFCSSNGFRKNYNCVVEVDDYFIEFIGEELRYLAPNLRSVASLIFKANQIKDDTKRYESTSGIYISKIKPVFPEPFYQLQLNSKKADIIPNFGTYTFEDNFQKIHIPASTWKQGIIWLNTKLANK